MHQPTTSLTSQKSQHTMQKVLRKWSMTEARCYLLTVKSKQEEDSKRGRGWGRTVLRSLVDPLLAFCIGVCCVFVWLINMFRHMLSEYGVVLSIEFWFIARYLHMLHRLQHPVEYSYIILLLLMQSALPCLIGYRPKRRQKCIMALCRDLTSCPKQYLLKLCKRV